MCVILYRRGLYRQVMFILHSNPLPLKDLRRLGTECLTVDPHLIVALLNVS